MKTLKALTCALTLAGASAAHALGIADPAADFLSTYTGPRVGDLDVLTSFVSYDPAADKYLFWGTMAAAIGTTTGALYVWGVDRGAGTEVFQNPPPGQPATGAGVIFDSVVLLRPDGTGLVNVFGAGATNLPVGSVFKTGNTIFGVVDGALLPSSGLAKASYTWNLWPRVGVGNNAQISDFAPDASNLAVAVVPEPSTYAMLGLGLAALAWRRRRPPG